MKTFEDTPYGDMTGQHHRGKINVKGKKLTSLKGSPDTVGIAFNCRNNFLTNLDGAPKRVDGDFYCEHNLIENLKGFDINSVGVNFMCTDNANPFLLDEYRFRRSNPTLSDDEIDIEMYKETGYEGYLPTAAKEIFLF